MKREGFTKLPNWAFELKLKNPEFVLFAWLLSHDDAYKPTITKAKTVLDIDIRTIDKAIFSLSEKLRKYSHLDECKVVLERINAINKQRFKTPSDRLKNSKLTVFEAVGKGIITQEEAKSIVVERGVKPKTKQEHIVELLTANTPIKEIETITGASSGYIYKLKKDLPQAQKEIKEVKDIEKDFIELMQLTGV